jgi:hypothetical protein
MKYKAGDRVTIVLDETDVEEFNSNTESDPDLVMAFYYKQIIAHEPAPFSWDDVKPGMAFNDVSEGLCWYICKSVLHDDAYMFEQDEVCLTVAGCDLEDLTRSPENDIEVK